MGTEPPPRAARREDRLSAGRLCGSSGALFERMYLDRDRAAVNIQTYPPGGMGSSVRVQELSSVSWGSAGVFSRTFEAFDYEVL